MVSHDRYSWTRRRPPAGFLRRAKSGIATAFSRNTWPGSANRSGTPHRSRRPDQPQAAKHRRRRPCRASLVQRKEELEALERIPSSRPRKRHRGVARRGSPRWRTTAQSAHSGARSRRSTKRRCAGLMSAGEGRHPVRQNGSCRAGGRPRSENPRLRKRGHESVQIRLPFIFSSVRFSSTVCCATRWMWPACSAKPSVQAVW